MRVFITYKLRMGVSRDRYRRWSREVDQVVASRQPGVLSYAVYEVGGTAKGEAPYDVVEDIEVESREAWDKVNGYPEMQPVVKEWLDLCDPDSVSVVYASPI
jgi:REDY-like protein HapK